MLVYVFQLKSIAAAIRIFLAGIPLISGCNEYDTKSMEPRICFLICIIGEEHFGQFVNSLYISVSSTRYFLPCTNFLASSVSLEE